MIWSAVSLRFSLSDTNMRPELLPPVKAVTFSTSGSRCTMPASFTSRCCMAWKELDWSATIEPFSRPVSCCGKKPLGTITYK